MTRTFAVDKRECQRGVTLFELLIALALIALLTTAAVGGVRASSPHLHIKMASEQLLADLKRARGEAEITSKPVSVVFSNEQYDIEALNLQRIFPTGIQIAVNNNIVKDSDTQEIIFKPGFKPSSHSVVIWKSERRAEIIIDPITHRVSLR